MDPRRQRLYRTEAIILSRHNYGEADKFLTLYTPDQGKIRVLAKGVRKIKSRKSGHVELLAHSELLVAKGRNIDIVTQAETIEPFRPLREDLMRTTYGYYVAELVDRFTEEGVENRPLFDLLLGTLEWIVEATDLDLVVRFFELRFLNYIGFRPQLFHCVQCEAGIEPVTNFFSPGDGGVLCPRCGEGQSRAKAISVNALKLLRFLQTRDHSTCRRVRVSERSHRELEKTMHRYLVYLLERQLKSVDFLHDLRHQMAHASYSSASTSQ